MNKTQQASGVRHTRRARSAAAGCALFSAGCALCSAGVALFSAALFSAHCMPRAGAVGALLVQAIAIAQRSVWVKPIPIEYNT